MKTVRVTFLLAIITASVYSCTSDRDEESTAKSESPVKLDLRKLKTNNKTGAVSKIGDTIQVNAGDGPKSTTGSTDPNNDTGEDPIVDPTKPDKPW
ncbi:hypothetical protein [Chryseobacterium sp. WLY505]|uniref:hypothetical protein n=1 Tax=Chryseobacterium sp. WLY505 TaxID=3068892 RepID=UPI0027967877|nr:hypothetical protein [Chryseobacterium sp. WLY505]MDQ1855711.1 hypothetical protein [Chryseobacterium sp. WLY505]